MPVLPLEPYVFPADLLANPTFPPLADSRWWVLHTRPRAEKCLARQFIDRAIPFFLPLYKRRWRCRGRMLCSHLPLFNGYIFLLGDAEARLDALKTNLVARFLTVEDQEQLHADLVRVHHMMASGAPLAPEERLKPGMLVQITSGPLAGLEGKISRRGNRLKLIVEVHFLQRGASVEIEAWMVQSLGAEPRVAQVGA